MSVIITDPTGGILPVKKNDHLGEDLLVTALSNKSLASELKRLATQLPLPIGSREFAILVEAGERIESMS